MNDVISAILHRKSTRNFEQGPLAEDDLLVALEAANRAPSGFNLQPWYFVVVRDPEQRLALRDAALDQRQVSEAPVVVAFVADTACWKSDFDETLTEGVKSGWIPKTVAAFYRQQVSLFFSREPLGLFGLAKRFGIPARRLFKATPHAICSHSDARHYVRSQTMLSAATFMIAAHSLGIATCPMEGFDESRVKKVLKVPNAMSIPVIIAAGYERKDEEDSAASPRKPLTKKVRVNVFPKEEQAFNS